MEALRTPDERFEKLPVYSFAPHYAEVDGLRNHFVDEGPRDGAVVLQEDRGEELAGVVLEFKGAA